MLDDTVTTPTLQASGVRAPGAQPAMSGIVAYLRERRRQTGDRLPSARDAAGAQALVQGHMHRASRYWNQLLGAPAAASSQARAAQHR